MRVFSILFFAALTFFCLVIVRPDAQWLAAIQSALPFGSQDLSAEYQAGFRKALIQQTNEVRGLSGVEVPLTLDAEMQSEVDRFVVGASTPRKIELDQLFSTIQGRFPETQAMSATMIYDPRDETLQESITEWADVTDPNYDSLSVVLFNQGLRRGALAVLTSRMEKFDLAGREDQRGRFFRVCSLCDESHAVELDAAKQTLILKCPHCEQRYDMIAGGSDGRFRHAPEFLEGFSFTDVPASTRYDTMMHLWKTVLRECEYEQDLDENREAFESWKSSSETWRDRSGDCEDTSILLADALISAGIEARVAVGRNIHIGDHAWVIARVDGVQYVLESTGGDHPRREPERVSEVARVFQPEELFDREKIYFSSQEGPNSCGDYWDESRWTPR